MKGEERGTRPHQLSFTKRQTTSEPLASWAVLTSRRASMNWTFSKAEVRGPEIAVEAKARGRGAGLTPGREIPYELLQTGSF